MPIEILNPLKWPSHLPHTPRGRQTNLHGFPPTLTVEDSLQFLDDELAKLKPIRAELSTHIEHFNSPRLRKLENVSPAVSLYLRMEDGKYHIACDRWLMPQANVYSLVLTLRSILQMDHWGVVPSREVLALFRERVPAPAVTPSTQSVEPWRAALGLGPTATQSDANAVYRARAKVLGDHDPEGLIVLNNAIEQARQLLPAGE